MEVIIISVLCNPLNSVVLGDDPPWQAMYFDNLLLQELEENSLGLEFDCFNF